MIILSVKKMSEIQAGSKVTMHFSLTLEDGTVAEDSFDSKPLEFTMGDGSLNEGLELGLYGMKAGEEETLTMTAEQTFGFHDPENIHDMPRSEFDVGMDLAEGMIIGFTTPAGDEVPGMIKEVSEKSVLVDFNHTLAGHELIYRVKILDVSE
jgi:FKBP-type peptidyl-prolyl cis-trans isomerase SlpA